MSLSKTSAWMIGLAIAVMGITLYAPFAMAIGDDVALGNFSCSGGVASGQLYLTNATCPTTLAFDNVFTFLVCNMQALASNLLGHMYCGLINELTPAIYAAVTLAVLFFGISFTIGLTAATGREAMVFLLKIAFVLGFTTSADLLIGVGYKMLLSAMSDGISIVISGMGVLNVASGNEAFMMLDQFLAQIFNYVIGGAGAASGPDKCKGALFAVIATMAIAFPIVAWFALALIGRFLLAFCRAVFGYIYAIFAITFLMILAPFFVTFYLFKPTQSYFEKWLGSLVSFVIQAVLLFAFLLFILSLPVSNMTQGINNIIMYQEQTQETTAVRLPWQYCTVCDFKIVDPSNPTQKIDDEDIKFLEKAQLACNIYPVNVEDANGNGFDPSKPATDAQGRKPLNVTFMLAPDTGSGQINALLELAGQGILSLIILAILVQETLMNIPKLAQTLGRGLGGSMVPQLGGGGSISGRGDDTLKLPGESMIRDFSEGVKGGMQESAGTWIPRQGQVATIAPNAGKVSDGEGSAKYGIQSGIANMVSGRKLSGEAFAPVSKKDTTPTTGLSGTWRRTIGDAPKLPEKKE